MGFFGFGEHEGIKLLKDYQKKLAKAEADYKAGSFSGHPDEQLELIDDYRSWVDSIEAARARGWSVDSAAVEKAYTSFEWFLENTPLKEGTVPYQVATSSYLETISWAESGLI